MREVNERRDPRRVEARPLPRAAPAAQAAMVRRARRRKQKVLAGAGSEEASMGRKGMSPQVS